MALQDLHIRNRFPNFDVHHKRGKYIWIGGLQPCLSSPIYQVIIDYQSGKVPEVRVHWPALASNAPHLYQRGTLCLYWPNEWRWHGDELIADTILPWTASWLYYYELWLDTGQWLGPSSHDLPISKSEDNRAA